MRLSAIAFVFVVGLSIGVGCGRNRPKEDPSAEHVAPPVPAPEGLIAEIVVSHPDRTWEAVRGALGPMPLLPTSPAVFLGDALGLPVGALEQLDLVVPLVGAVVETHDAIVSVVGIHVKDGSRFVDLATAPGGRFTKGATQDGVTALKAAAKINTWAYAVAGNYLVVGQDAETVLRVAPFVTRTLSSRPAASEDVVAVASQASLQGPVTRHAKQLWASWKHDRESDDAAMRAKHGGSAPDFGDPAEALADIDAKVGRFFAILGDLAESRLAVVIDPKAADRGAALRASLTMKPLSASGPAGREIQTMPVAGADPLLSLPTSVAAALLTRDTPELREQSSSEQVGAIAKVLGGRLDEDDKGKIESAFRSWSTGRGDWLTAGLVWSGPSKAAVLRGAVSDPAELGRGTIAMLKLLGVRAIAEPLSTWIGDLKLSALPAPSLGDGAVQTVHVVRRPPKVQLRHEHDKPAQNDTFDIVWSIGKDVFSGALGSDAKGAYAALQKADAGKTLAQVPFLSRTLERLGPTLSFVLFVDSAKLSETAPAGGEGAPVILAYGKDRQNQAWLELDAPASVISAYAALLNGL